MNSWNKEICQERFESNWWRCRTSWVQIFPNYTINIFSKLSTWLSMVIEDIQVHQTNYLLKRRCFFYFCISIIYHEKYMSWPQISFWSLFSFSPVPSPILHLFNHLEFCSLLFSLLFYQFIQVISFDRSNILSIFLECMLNSKLLSS